MNAVRISLIAAILALVAFRTSADTVHYTLDEITLAGSVHDDGVDISLFLAQPLTPASGSPLDLDLSKYEIGGNGFHTGLFVSGSIGLSAATDAGDAAAATSVRLTISPNPFAPRTTVTYSVARSGPVRVSVHDVRGRLVTTLVDRWQSSGRYSVPWTGDGAVAGVYFVRCVTGSESGTHKAVLRR